MRILIVSALLIATASCAWPPPPAQVAAPPLAAAAVPAPVPPPVALMAPPPAVIPAPPPVAVAPPPPPMIAPAPVVFAPFAWLFGPILTPPPGRLTLSNFSFDNARVEAVITGAPDCAVREGTTASNFVLPLNGTRVIQSVPGADICWRRAIEPGRNAGAVPSVPGWTEWSRVFLSSGRSVDSRL